jgi:anti-anti-sigma factor
MESLAVEVEQQWSVVRVAVFGELDLAGAQRVEDALMRAEQRTPRLLVLDLRGLTFMDSTGLELVLAAHSRSCLAGRELKVLRPPEPAAKVFHLTRVDDFLPIVDDSSAVVEQEASPTR